MTQLKRFNSLRSMKSKVWNKGHKPTVSNASSVESTVSTNSQHELKKDLFVIDFHRKAPRDQVEQVKKMIIENGGVVREILILPYQIKATLQGSLVKDLMHLKVVKRVDHIPVV